MSVTEADRLNDSANTRRMAAQLLAYRFLEAHFANEVANGGRPQQLAYFTSLDQPTLDEELLTAFQSKPPEQLPEAIYLDRREGETAHVVAMFTNELGVHAFIDRFESDQDGIRSIRYTARTMTDYELRVASSDIDAMINGLAEQLTPKMREALIGGSVTSRAAELVEV